MATTKYARRGDLDILRAEDLDKFVEKVAKLKAEGMDAHSIAARFGISVFTLRGRLRDHKLKRQT